MSGLRFATPLFLLLLPLAAVPAYWLWTARGVAKFRFSSLRNFSTKQLAAIDRRKILPILRAAGLVFLILALARPQTGKALSEVSTEAVDIELVLDTSGSMKAMDFTLGKERVTRLDAVKSVVAEFIKNRPTDRIGMVVFGEEAFTQCPQTLDHGILLSFLDELQVGMAGDSTAIGSAIGIATKRLKGLKSKSKVMVLLTDGRSNSGPINPDQAAEAAKAFGIKIYTIGVGSKEGKAPFVVEGFFGKQIVYQDVDLDEETLQKIASITGGRYFRATDTTSLKQIYDEIDRLEKTEIKTKEYFEYEEHFPRFAWLGLVMLVMEVGLAQTVLRKIP